MTLSTQKVRNIHKSSLIFITSPQDQSPPIVQMLSLTVLGTVNNYQAHLNSDK